MAVVEWWNFIAKKEQLLSISTTTICVVLCCLQFSSISTRNTHFFQSLVDIMLFAYHISQHIVLSQHPQKVYIKNRNKFLFFTRNLLVQQMKTSLSTFSCCFSPICIFSQEFLVTPSGFHKFLSTLSLSCRKSHFTTHFRSISHISQQNKTNDTQSRSLYYKWIGKRCCSILFFSSLFRCSHFLDILYWIATINRFTIVLTVDISNALQFFPTTRLVIESEQFGQIRYWHDSSESIPCFHKGKFIRR